MDHADVITQITRAWADSPRLTVRQAYGLAAALDRWGDEIGEWLSDRSSAPLHTIDPFDYFDLRVMMLVGESAAFAAAAQERCFAVAEEIVSGKLPFDRDGCLFDELLMSVALRDAQLTMQELPELFEALPVRNSAPGAGDEGYGGSRLADDEWDVVSDGFDDACRWDEWEVPVMSGHILLPAVLAERHPFRWFDPGPGTGSGYLRQLSSRERS